MLIFTIMNLNRLFILVLLKLTNNLNLYVAGRIELFCWTENFCSREIKHE